MTPEQIIEIARRFANEKRRFQPFELNAATVYLTDWEFPEKDLIAFAQAIIEERESIGEPVAWIDHEGGLYHYKLYETYLPLYRHPRPKSRLTDEEIIQIGHATGALEGNHMLPIAFARAIEGRINGEKEARLAEDDEEPFLWVETDKNGELNWDVTCMFSDSPAFIERPLPLYRRPLPMARLTDEEIEEIHKEFPSRIDLFARAIEQKIWEKKS